ncbi:uncharacterized protein [Trachinotus anak]|uniref:uncharacterized protein n=1 Tax=Trachinotus anak TaxID=443729 RepID=UPI0039F23CB1
MTSALFVFYLTCLFLGRMAQTTNLKFSSSIRQERHFVSAKTGDNLTLQCFYEGDFAARYYWYKQSLGQKPRLVSTFYKFKIDGSFHDEFQNNPRFTLDSGNGKNHLNISDLRSSDSATYYCASSYSYKFEFAEGIVVTVKGSGLNIHQSVSETIQPGGSATLSCTVHTGTCDGEHSVYWFKNSEESHPGLVYTHTERNGHCERKHNTQTHTCVYNLPIEQMNLSHAGTYYCAVASCGHILFGNGTKLDSEVEVDCFVLLYFLIGALAFTTILSASLVVFMCVINKNNRCKCAESHARSPAPSTINTEGQRNEDNIHYAALREHRVNRSRRQRDNTQSECVYSSIKMQN